MFCESRPAMCVQHAQCCWVGHLQLSGAGGWARPLLHHQGLFVGVWVCAGWDPCCTTRVLLTQRRSIPLTVTHSRAFHRQAAGDRHPRRLLSCCIVERWSLCPRSVFQSNHITSELPSPCALLHVQVSSRAPPSVLPDHGLITVSWCQTVSEVGVAIAPELRSCCAPLSCAGEEQKTAIRAAGGISVGVGAGSYITNAILDKVRDHKAVHARLCTLMHGQEHSPVHVCACVCVWFETSHTCACDIK